MQPRDSSFSYAQALSVAVTIARKYHTFNIVLIIRMGLISKLSYPKGQWKVAYLIESEMKLSAGQPRFNPTYLARRIDKHTWERAGHSAQKSR